MMWLVVRKTSDLAHFHHFTRGQSQIVEVTSLCLFTLEHSWNLKKIMTSGKHVGNRACSATAYCWRPPPPNIPINATLLDCPLSAATQQRQITPCDGKSQGPEEMVSKARGKVTSCLTQSRRFCQKSPPVASFIFNKKFKGM